MDKKRVKVKTETATKNDFVITSALDQEVDIVTYPYLYKKFDVNGNVLKEITYDQNENIQEFFTYKYDDKNRKVEAKNFYDENEVTETIKYFYADRNEPEKAIKLYADGSKDDIEYKYDQSGNLIEKRTINEDGEVEECEKWRFEENREVWYEKSEYGEPVFREERKIGKDGRVSEIVLWEALDDKTTIHKISYNKKGQRNLVEKLNDKGQRELLIEISDFFGDNPAKIVETTSAGKKITEIAYDDKGRYISEKEFDEEGNVIRDVQRSYNDNGFLKDTEVKVDLQGKGMNFHYRINYDYEYYDD